MRQYVRDYSRDELTSMDQFRSRPFGLSLAESTEFPVSEPFVDKTTIEMVLLIVYFAG